MSKLLSHRGFSAVLVLDNLRNDVDPQPPALEPSSGAPMLKGIVQQNFRAGSAFTLAWRDDRLQHEQTRSVASVFLRTGEAQQEGEWSLLAANIPHDPKTDRAHPSHSGVIVVNSPVLGLRIDIRTIDTAGTISKDPFVVLLFSVRNSGTPMTLSHGQPVEKTHCETSPPVSAPAPAAEQLAPSAIIEAILAADAHTKADPHSPNNASLFRVLSRPSVLASQTPPILDPFQQAKADGEKLRQELDAEKERSLYYEQAVQRLYSTLAPRELVAYTSARLTNETLSPTMRVSVAIAKQSAKGILAEHRRLAFAGEVEHLVAAVLRFVYGSEHQHQPAGGAASGGA